MSTDLATVYPSIPWLASPGTAFHRWRLTVQGPGGPFVINAGGFLAVPSLEQENRLRVSSVPERTFSGRFEVLLDADAAAVRALQAAVEACRGVYTGSVEVLDDADAQAIVLATGVLQELRADGVGARVVFGDGYPRADRPICRDGSLLAGFDELEGGSWLPQVFGRRGFLLPALFRSERALLAEDLPSSAKTLLLTAPVTWPARGIIQLNDERIVYSALSQDGLTLGSDGAPLGRPNRRAHERGSAVVLLPEAGPVWCVADHGAVLVEARADSELGQVLGGNAVAAEDLDGIAATLLRRPLLPLVATTSRIPALRRTVLDGNHWTIAPDSDALDPVDGFAHGAPSRGSVLTTSRRLLAAVYRHDLSRSEWRFDRVASAVLCFEVSETPNWGPETRLRVRIEKGAAAVEVDINHRGLVVPVEVRGTGAIPKGGVPARTAEWRRVSFETLTATGSWIDTAAAIDGRFTGSAVHQGTGPGALAAAFVTERPERSLTLHRSALLARVRNAGGGSLPVRLTASLPGELLREQDWILAEGEVSILRLGFEPPTNVEAADLFAPDAVYTLTLPGGGTAEVEELWLEVEVEQSVPASTVLAAISSLPVLGSVDLRIPYDRMAVDISPLLQAWDPWGFFPASGGGSPKVTFELVNPPAITNWAVYLRAIAWEITVNAATSVRPTERIWGLVEGRRCREDGTGNPALVILDLLREPGLGAEPEAALEVESFTGRVGIADERDLAFAAAFLEGTSLGRALGRALAESAFTLTRRAGRWGLAAPALGLDEAVYPALPAADWYPGTGPRRVAGLEPGTAGGLMIRNVTEGILLREAGAIGLAVEARWLVRGAAALARFLNARRLPPAHTVSLRGDARWTGLPAGSPLSLEGLRQPGVVTQGELARVAMEDGILEGVLAHIDDVQGLIPPGRALLLRGARARALRFVIDNRVVAMLTDGGDLLIRGNLREGALAPTESTLPILFDGGQSMLLCVYTAPGGGGSSAFALTPDGDLLTTGPLVEEAPITDPAPAGGVAMLAVATHLGGGAITAARLTLDSLAIRGILHTRQSP